MNKENKYIKEAIRVWYVPIKTDGQLGMAWFCLMENLGRDGGYLVRILYPEAYRESEWLYGGPWETESGAAWAILNELDINQE